MTILKVPTLALYINPEVPLENQILLIEKAEFKRCTGDTEPGLYYSGTLFELMEAPDEDFPIVPKTKMAYSTTIINVAPEYVKPLQ